MNKKASGFSRKKNFFYHVGALEEEEMLKKAPYRIFATMQEYNQWCERALPTWLGYGKGR